MKIVLLLVDFRQSNIFARATVEKSKVGGRQFFSARHIKTFVKLAGEQIDANNGEDQPEYQADQKYVEYRRNSSDKSVDNNLGNKHTLV